MDYALRDFLMFTPEVYLRLFERLNAALWPWQIIPLGLLLLLPTLVSLAQPVGRRLAMVVLAAGWASTARLFMQDLYAPINWPISAFSWAFFAEAGLLLAVALWSPPGRVSVAVARTWILVGLGLTAVTLLGQASWRSVGWPGLTPDSTAVVTLLFLLATTRRWRWVVLAVPLVWLGFSLLTHWALGLTAQAVLSLAGVILGLVALVWPGPRETLSRPIR